MVQYSLLNYRAAKKLYKKNHYLRGGAMQKRLDKKWVGLTVLFNFALL